MTPAAPDVTLEPVSPATRAGCAALAVRDDQRRFVAPVADYLAVCDAEGAWTPLAVCRAGEVVGFAMWGFDAGEGSHWVGGVVVDRSHQRQGVGRAALQRLIAKLAAEPGCREIALSYHGDNAAARRLYRSRRDRSVPPRGAPRAAARVATAVTETSTFRKT
jgi:diamine N-acetyltransferase